MPPLWKEGQENETHFHSPEGPLVPLAMEEKTLRFPASWGSKQSIFPQMPMRPSQSISPPLVLGLRKAVWVSPGSPCWGTGCRVEALPQSLPAGTQRSGQGAHVEGSCWKELNQCGGRRKGEGVGWWGQVLRCRHSDGSRGRSCARRSWRHQAEWHSQVEKAKRKGLPREATHLAITFRLTEAYTEARGGPFTHPQLHSQRLTASV